jgi:DinB superfamily
MTPSRRRVWDRVAAFPASLAIAVAASPAPDAPPAPGEWTAYQVVLHLIAVETDVWQARLDQLATEDRPSWRWVEPGPRPGPIGERAATAVERFAGVRRATVVRLDALDDAGWARRGRHATYGELDVEGLLRVLADHDEEHLGQIRG